MWLVTKQGFYSVVEHRDDANVLIVRCRAKGDLEALKHQLPELGIYYDDYADYPWRADVARADWRKATAQLVEEIDYDNFKKAVEKEQGRERHDLYMRVWGILLHLNERKGRLRRAWDSFRHHDPPEPLFDEDFTYFPTEDAAEDDPFLR